MQEDLARACRVLARHEMIDLWGHLSLRVPGSELVLVTPRFSRKVLPRSITAADVLACEASGRIVEGSGEMPRRFDVDLALYRKNEKRQACIFAAPRYAMAAAIAGYALKPLTHMESATAYDLEVCSGNDIAEALARAGAVTQPGIGAWAAGAGVFDCLATLHHLEYLAQANAIIAGEKDMRSVAREDSDKLWRQFTGQHHYHEFFASLDPGPLVHPFPGLSKNHDLLKARIALSCRALWERGTLVGFLEHISHRLPGGDRFLISASKNFGDIGPQDMCLLDMEANLIEGPRPPGFKWFHAQLLREREDVQAVVHTHDLYGRAYALSPRSLAPAYRVGLEIATRRLPMYSRCDLIVDPQVRRETLDALGTGPLVHEIGHGTDFVAETLERATVDAIQREAFLAMDHLARRFGAPQPLPAGLAEEIRAAEAPAEDWWWFYTAEVGAPRRSAGGLSNR
jgi:ribulose-5-phosphate 4-epimerase/fuculose-1-phosphate aldolase